MKMPKLAVLDGDILAYRAAWWADKEGVDLLEGRLHKDVAEWSSFSEQTLVSFSCSREDNYRRDYFPLYKRNRTTRAEPECLKHAKDILKEGWSCISRPRIEADDIMGMMASGGLGLAVTIDKDLKSVPGWHYNPDKDDKPVLITEEEADLFLYVQWLSGDLTDNIFGAWNWGPKKSEKILKSIPREEWDAQVFSIYKEFPRPDNKAIEEISAMESDEFALSQAICVRILREGEYNKETKEVVPWIPQDQ